MGVPREVEKVAAALGRLLDCPVVVLSRDAWEAALRAGGKPTRLPAPLGPYQGIQLNPGFEFAAASGLVFTADRGGEAGMHNVRRDEKDAPEGLFNTDSYIVIEKLTSRPLWPEVLRVAGLVDSQDLRTLCNGYVYAYPRNRDDHHSPTVPKDIRDAEPK